MNLRWIWMGHLRGLRQRWTRTLLGLLAVGAGAAMVVGVQISNHSLNSSLAQFNDSISFGAGIHIEGPAEHGTVDASVLPNVVATPGVEAAIPLVVTVVEASDSRGASLLVPVIGVDCSVEAIVGAFGCDPQAMANAGDTPVLGQALKDRLGSTGALHTNLTDVATRDAPTISQLSRINNGQVAVFTLGASQRHFTRPNGLDVILVLPDEGVDEATLIPRLRDAVGTQNNVYGSSVPIGGGGFASVASILTPFLFLISLIGLVIGAQLVRNSTDMSLEERRRELATTSALGARPRDLVLGVMAESVVVGLLGAVVAILGGRVIAAAFVGKLSNELAKASGLRAEIATPSSAVVVGILVAVGVSVLASLAPARRAARIDLVAELSGRRRFDDEKNVRRRGLVVSGALMAVVMVVGYVAHQGGSLAAWQPPATLLALVGSMVVGYVLCVQLAPRLLSVLQRAPGFETGPARVALTNIVRARRRTVAVAVAITAPVFFSVILSGIAPGMGEAAKAFAGDNYGDRVYASTLPTNNSAGIDSKVTPAMERAIMAVPGVAAIEHHYFASFADPETTWFSVDGFEGPAPHERVYRGGTPEEVFGRGEVMIGPALARLQGLDVGDTFTIPARIGPRHTFTVGGIWAAPDNLGRSVTMHAVQLLALTGPRPAADLTIKPAAGVSSDELARRLQTANIDDRLRFMNTDELAADFTREFLRLASPFDALRFALVAVALVATASTLVLAAVQRRRDNATLAALGMAPADMARSTLIETVITALAVTVVATVCGQFALINFTWASAMLTGLAIPYRFSVGPVASAAAVTALIALVGALLPAWRTARTNVMEALRTA